MPKGIEDAETRHSVIAGKHGRDVQWKWYHSCIRQMLKEAGCEENDLDDITHDFIVEKLDRVIHGYKPKQGRFRAYLYRAVKNTWIDRLRSIRVKDSRAAHIASDDLAHGDLPPEDSPSEDLRVLNLFFDNIFSRFVREMTKTQVGFFLLRDWCMSGRDIETSIREKNLSISAEYARKVRAEAVTTFAAFIEDQLSKDDFALMAEDAQRSGIALGIVHEAKSIAGVFRWPSEKKRLGTVALLLRHLYLKYQRQGGNFEDL
jgi:RNA polymerase sigma factor (sigma-70 family)